MSEFFYFMFILILVFRLILPLQAFILFLSSLSGYQTLGPSIAQALISVHLWTMFLLCNKIESKQCNVDVTLLFHIEGAKLLFVFV